jgi:hypothetical protein
MPRLIGRGRALEVLLGADDITPPHAEIAPEWDCFLDALARPAAQARLKTLFERGFHKPGDVETRLGYHVGLLGAR